jgi:hypothetical protein
MIRVMKSTDPRSLLPAAFAGWRLAFLRPVTGSMGSAIAKLLDAVDVRAVRVVGGAQALVVGDGRVRVEAEEAGELRLAAALVGRRSKLGRKGY